MFAGSSHFQGEVDVQDLTYRERKVRGVLLKALRLRIYRIGARRQGWNEEDARGIGNGFAYFACGRVLGGDRRVRNHGSGGIGHHARHGAGFSLCVKLNWDEEKRRHRNRQERTGAENSIAQTCVTWRTLC